MTRVESTVCIAELAYVHEHALRKIAALAAETVANASDKYHIRV